MSNYITVDTGTTNTRISLFYNGKIKATLKINVGVGDNKKNPHALNDSLKSGISQIVCENGMSENEFECIIACGMITSELGLCALEHLTVPCNIEKLANNLHKTAFPEISSLPFFFVKGVKIIGESFEKTDMMRGEETEILGLTDNIERNCMYVLPGSHSKLILTDQKGEIASFSTELTGELMRAIAENTMVSQSINLSENVDADLEYLKIGYNYAKENGVNEALFKVRILDKLFGCNKSQLCGYFKGAVFQSEIDNIINSNAKKVIIAGKEQLRKPMCYLLSAFSNKTVVSVDNVVSDIATAMGMVKIYEYSKNFDR